METPLCLRCGDKATHFIESYPHSNVHVALTPERATPPFAVPSYIHEERGKGVTILRFRVTPYYCEPCAWAREGEWDRMIQRGTG